MGDRTGQERQNAQLGRHWSSRMAGVRLVAANRSLRRLATAWGLFNVAEYAIVVALGVYAFSQGGTLAVGLVALARTLPGLVSGPLAAVAADRWRRGRLLVVGLAGRAVVTAGIVVCLTLDLPYVVYVLAALDATLASSFWPAMAALTAEFSREPAELTAANATAALMENLGTLLGPVLAGSILLAGSVSWVFVLAVALFVGAVFAARPLRSSRVRKPAEAGLRRLDIAGGWIALKEAPEAVWVLSLWGLESLVLGMVDVLIVVLSFEALGLGDAGVGYLSAAGGVGGVVAAGVVSVVAQRSGRLVAIGLTLFGIALLLAGALPTAAVVFVALGLVGAASAWVDVGAQTLVQRLIPDERLGRVLGLYEGWYWASLGLGGLAGSALIVATGPAVAAIAIGAGTLVLGLVSVIRLGRIDLAVSVPAERLGVLRGVEMLARLPIPTLERLARRGRLETVAPGTTIIKEGERGDRYYVVVAGVVDVRVQGSHLARLGRGEGFGEIALLADQPRNADVVSGTETRLLSFEGTDFLGAVTGHSGAAAAADQLVASRLATRAARHRA